MEATLCTTNTPISPAAKSISSYKQQRRHQNHIDRLHTRRSAKNTQYPSLCWQQWKKNTDLIRLFTTPLLALDALLERPLRFFAIIEMQLFGANNLIVLMTFARDQNKIPWPRRRDRLGNRDRSIGFHLVVDA